MSATPPVRILLVDDERSVLITLGQILTNRGYEVTTIATVAEALAQITSKTFDVLIADLNIGQPGDGFTVVSAMRRTQPECTNFILTGYPALDTALQALRSHVDDYLTKPADIQALVKAIESRKDHRRRFPPSPPKRMAMLITENGGEIAQKVLIAVKSHPELRKLRISDEERIDHLPGVLSDLAEDLESQSEETSTRAIRAASQHGKARHDQRYSIPMMIEETRILGDAIFEVVQSNLLALDLSSVIVDVRRLNAMLQAQLKASVTAFLDRRR